MTVNPQRVSRLQEYGLTEYESRAYLALLELEKAEASQIADLSRVPRTKIYQALDGLEGKKLIKVVPERPKRYLVQAFTNYLNDLESNLRGKADDLANQKDELVQEFAPRGNVHMESAGGFIVLKGRANIASKLAELAGRAEEHLTVATSEMGARRFAYHNHVLEERAQKDVTIRVLAQKGPGNEEAVRDIAPYCEMRHGLVDLGSVTIAFMDGKEALIVHHVPDDHHYFQGSDVALWTDDPALVACLATLADLAWQTALPWEEAVPEATADAPTATAKLGEIAKDLIAAQA